MNQAFLRLKKYIVKYFFFFEAFHDNALEGMISQLKPK